MFLGLLATWYSVNLKMIVMHSEDTPKSTFAAQILDSPERGEDKVGWVGKQGMGIG